MTGSNNQLERIHRVPSDLFFQETSVHPMTSKEIQSTIYAQTENRNRRTCANKPGPKGEPQFSQVLQGVRRSYIPCSKSSTPH